MSYKGRNFHDLNSVRGYPLDDTATGLSDAGVRMPDGILVDACLRFPRTIGQFAYLMAVNSSPTQVSFVIGVADELDDSTMLPIAALSLSAPILSGKPYELKPLLVGVAGWLVFGPNDEPYAGKFSTPSQSRLLDRVARPYQSLPVPWISKTMDEHKLVSETHLFGGTDIEVITGQRLIEGALKDAVIIRLTGDLQAKLEEYAGTCGGRPDSRTCILPGVESISGATPDANGDIEIAFGGMRASSIPNGVLVSTSASLPELCGDRLVSVDEPVDYCSSLSEISESTGVSDSISDSVSDSVSTSESSSVVDVTYPKCVRFFSDETSPLSFPYGAWDKTAAYPHTFPCWDGGHDEPTWRSQRTNHTPLAVGNPCGSQIAIFNNPDYTQAVNMSVETSLRVIGADAIAGVLFGYRRLWDRSYPDGFAAVMDRSRSSFSIGYWTPSGFLPLVSSKKLYFDSGYWHKIQATITQDGADIVLQASLGIVGGNSSRSIQTRIQGGWRDSASGRFGLLAMGQTAENSMFAYLRMDLI